jgi:hypothetical protein
MEKIINTKQACRDMKGISLREKCRRIAFNTEELFPHVCIDIMEEVYGKRMERMSPNAICDVVLNMMATWVDPDRESCMEAVQMWCENY